jgi:menaquinone-specific isochorismate synthase
MTAPRSQSTIAAAAAGGSASGSRVESVRVPAGGADPVRFLRRAAGRPRGFWQSQGRWSAFSGRVLELDSRDFPDGETGTAEDLFTGVRKAGRGIVQVPDVHDPPEGPEIRWYGGFAFDTQGPASDGETLWEAFPAARFVLPELQLLGTPDGTSLVAIKSPTSDGEGPAREPLSARAERVVLELESEERVGAEGDVPPAVSFHPHMSTARWTEAVSTILDRLERDEFEKVVLARALDVTLADVPDPICVLDSLRAGNPNANVFYLEIEPGAVFLGASPELLCSQAGSHFVAQAVAGSTPRGKSDDEDRRLGRRLLESEKDQVELAICIRELEENLAGLVSDLRIDAETRLLRLADIQHLRVDVTGNVPARAHVLSLAAALHPTAAVCGYPRSRALEAIREVETASRGWYAGAVGWFDQAGCGEFAPGLRSAIIAGRMLRLYAGAGIVAGSEPGPEWEETRVKLMTVIRALGLERTE